MEGQWDQSNKKPGEESFAGLQIWSWVFGAPWIVTSLLHQMYVTVGGTPCAQEIETAHVSIFIADPVFSLGAEHELDGAGAVLDDSVSNVLARL